MIARRIIPALIVAAVFAVANREADAQYLYGQPWGYGPYGHPFGSSLYSLGRIPVPPYFALHPPVYYSGIETTTYGSSPIARPPRCIDYPVHDLPAPNVESQGSVRMRVPDTQSASATARKMVKNPYVRSEPTPAKPPAARPAPTHSAKVIVNPFVAQAEIASRD